MWAKEDNPERYHEFILQNRSHLTIQALTQLCNGTHHSVSKITYYLLCDKFKYDILVKKWYMFDGTLWKVDSDNIGLRKELSTTIKTHYIDVLSEYTNKFLGQDDQSLQSSTSKKKGNETTITLSKTIQNLQDRRFKDNLCHELEEFFQDSNFYRNLDTNRNLIAFTNGVWDLTKMEFRKAESVDFLSTSVGYDYIDTLNPVYALKVKKYWETLHPNAEQREYILSMFARQLKGDVGNNLFHIHAGHLGSAANGKSTCFEALECCFGDYMRKFGVEMLTSKHRPDPSKPHPELGYWKGKRILYTSEPNHDDVINSGIMKDYTGGEKIIYRGLYSNLMDEFRPMFKMHIMTNDAPHVDGSDYGVRRRIRKIDYISQFVPKEQVNEEEHKYLRDDNFLSELRECHEYKMEFLRYFLKSYDDEFQYEMPECIATNSKEYIEENDNVFKFVQEFLTVKKDGYFTLKEAKELYKDSDHYNGKIQTLKNDLIKCLRKPCIGQKWIDGANVKNVFEGYTLLRPSLFLDT
jgi:phage/plasmid-associated DNA primase